MSRWPDFEFLRKKRKEIKEMPVPKWLDEHIRAVPSLSSRPERVDLVTAFHRCCICGHHPEERGDRTIKVGAHGERKYCEVCVTAMWEKMNALVVTHPIYESTNEERSAKKKE